MNLNSVCYAPFIRERKVLVSNEHAIHFRYELSSNRLTASSSQPLCQVWSSFGPSA